MSLSRSLFTGGIWLSMQRVISFAVQFGGGIILARLLAPEDFGAVAMAMGISLLVNRLASTGLSQEIMRLDEKSADFAGWISTFFWINAALLVCSLGLAVAVGYGTDLLSASAREVFVIVVAGNFLGNLFSPARVLLHKRMRFKAMSLLELVPQILTMACAVLMAYMGFGIWSLVVPQAVASVLSGLVVYTLARPPVMFVFISDAFQRIKREGPWYVLFGLSEEGYQRGDDLIIGAFFGEVVLGLYRRAYNLGSLLHNQIGTAINQLGYPVHANRQIAPEQKFHYLRLAAKVVLYVLFSLVIVLCLFIDDIILIIYGGKWVPASQYFIYLAPFAVLWPLYHTYKGYLIASGSIRFVSLIDAAKLIVMLAGSFALYSAYGVFGVTLAVNFAVFTGVFACVAKCYRRHLDKLVKLLPSLIYVTLVVLCLSLGRDVFYVAGPLIVIAFLIYERQEVKWLIRAVRTKS